GYHELENAGLGSPNTPARIAGGGGIHGKDLPVSYMFGAGGTGDSPVPSGNLARRNGAGAPFSAGRSSLHAGLSPVPLGGSPSGAGGSPRTTRAKRYGRANGKPRYLLRTSSPARKSTFALNSGVRNWSGFRICTFTWRVPFCRLASGAISAT